VAVERYCGTGRDAPGPYHAFSVTTNPGRLFHDDQSVFPFAAAAPPERLRCPPNVRGGWTVLAAPGDAPGCGVRDVSDRDLGRLYGAAVVRRSGRC
jgi:hypothetical protein